MCSRAYLYAFLVVVDLIQTGKQNTKRAVNMETDLQHISSTCDKLRDMLAAVQKYVDDIIVSH